MAKRSVEPPLPLGFGSELKSNKEMQRGLSEMGQITLAKDKRDIEHLAGCRGRSDAFIEHVVL